MDSLFAILAGAVSGVWGLVAGLFSPAPVPEDFVQFTAEPIQQQIETPAPEPRNIAGTAIDATTETRAYVENKRQENMVDVSQGAKPKDKDDGDGDAVTVLRE